ncbi:non-ribosomal peptide synthetase [Bordetella genomosp. 11]|nr:non-ribosomal peptide synthetase [Bordetella genomosp. 11]
MDQTLTRRVAAKFMALAPAQRRAAYRQMVETGMEAAQLPILPRATTPVLSHAQRRLWFLWRLDPMDATYHLPGALRLKGALDVQAVRAALIAVRARHAALRTRFVADDAGLAMPVVDADASMRVDFHDARVHSGDEREGRAGEVARAWLEQPFDLTAGPLLRAGLVRLADDEHLLVIVMHHIVADGWSVRLVMADFAAAYEAVRAGGTAQLPPAPSIAYTDYAGWQSDLLDAGEHDRQLTYWRNALGDEHPVLQIACDHAPRPGARVAAQVALDLEAATAARLRTLARGRGDTMFMLLLAAFQSLLYRYTGQDDIRLGVPAAGRHRAETQDVVGLFVNTQVLRARFQDDSTFEDAVGQARAAVLGAQAYPDLPFDSLVDALRPERSLDRNPLFQILFNHQQSDGAAGRMPPGLACAPYPLGVAALPVDLQCDTVEHADGRIVLTLRYARDRYEPATMRRLLQAYGAVLDAMSTTPGMRVADVPLLSAEDRAVLRSWTDGSPLGEAMAQWRDRPVHAVISAQAARTPDAVAVIMETDPALAADGVSDPLPGSVLTLTYAQLERQSNRLAQRLLALGVGPERRVAIAAHRHPSLVVGLLAVLKTGAAYVPLDPEYPDDRLSYMIEDSAPALVLTQSWLSARVREWIGGGARQQGAVPLLEIDTLDAPAGAADATTGQTFESNVAVRALDLPIHASDSVHSSALPDHALNAVHEPSVSVHTPDMPVHPEQACYVIYTSGSTGKPKGATNRHAGLSNRLAWMQQAYGLGPQDTVLQKTPFSFDVSVWEFFWPLMAGARLALAAVGEHRDAERLLGRIVAQQVSTLHFVPSMLHAFVAHCESQEDSAVLSAARKVLRRVFCSGEALPAELCARTYALFPGIELHNLYGPTEAAIDVTHWDCARPAATGVPIGRPIAGLRTYVLDAQLNEVPPGVGCELYLGGIGLGRGYLNRPGLSAERFVADPFGTGERLYRTGDLARWNREGQLEYLGRLDHQVKLRGQRIELGEIEAQLLAQDGVKQAVVLAQTGPALAGVAGSGPHEATNADGLGNPIGQNGFSVSRGPGEPAGPQGLDAQGSSGSAQASLRLVAYVTPASLDTAMLRQALERSLPAYMVPSAIVTLDTLPITANGKLDRKALPQAQFASTQSYEAPQGQLEETLAGIWREVLGVVQIGRHDNFFEVGGDSILSLQIVARLRQAGWRISPRQMFERQTVAALAQVAVRVAADGQPYQGASAHDASGNAAGQARAGEGNAEPDQEDTAAGQEEISAGQEVPLLPIQAQFLSLPLSTHNHWNQAVLLRSDTEVDIQALKAALAAVVSHHDALRLRYRRGEDGQWIQAYGDIDPVPTSSDFNAVQASSDIDPVQASSDIDAVQASSNIDTVQGDADRIASHDEAAPDAPDAGIWDLTAADAAEIEAHCARAQASLDITHGPLVRAARMRVADGSWRLLLVIHHLAVDGVSWRILLEDLRQAYEQARRQQAPRLAARTASYGAWARGLRRQAAMHAQEQPYWTNLPAGALPPPDRVDGPARVADLRRVEVNLTPAQTQALLRQAPSAYRTQVNDLLLASLALALRQWRGLRQIRIDLEGHGREADALGLDVTRTVGWFTTVYPVVLQTDGEAADLIRDVKERLRAVPRHGLGYGVLGRWGDASVRQALSGAPASPILFNYLGQFDAGVGGGDWRVAEEDVGSGQWEAAPLSHALTVNGRVYDGQLSLSLGYSGTQWHESTMRELAARWTEALSTVIGHCTSGAQGVTPSDFPLAGLTQSEVDALPIGQPMGQWQDVYPVTPMQAGMLFHAIYGNDADAVTRVGKDPDAGRQDTGRDDQPYINQLRVDIHGLDESRFQAAWESAVARHDVLRTGFIARAGAPLQWVARQARLPFERQQVRGDAGEVAARLDALAASQRAAGFDLLVPPLMRCLLVRVNDAYDHFIWTHHHLLLDGWSTSQLLGEVLSDYAGGAVARPAGRYRDYLQWLARRDAQATQAYWMGRLRELEASTLLAEAMPASGIALRASATHEGYPHEGSTLEDPRHRSALQRAPADECLTPDLAGGAAHGGTYGEWAIDLDAVQTQPLVAYARRERVTLNTLIQGAWSLVLGLHTGRDTVVFGATTSGRPDVLAGSQQVLGLYINTLPVVVRLPATQPVGSWLRDLQASNVAAREHEHTPLYDIQRWAGQGGQALFDTLVVFENYPVDEALGQSRLDGLRFSGLVNREQTSYPLTLVVSRKEGLHVHMSYDRAHYGSAAVEVLARRLLQVLRRLTLDAQGKLGTLSLLMPGEQDLLRSWTDGSPLGEAMAEWRDRPVHAVISAQAARTPDAVAVIMETDPALAADGVSDPLPGSVLTLTYAQLERQSNRLAQRLLALGVGPERLVAIAAHRHPSLVVGLLAVLKTGAAYVPLDPEYPDDRLSYMIEDSAPALVLTQSWLSARVREWIGGGARQQGAVPLLEIDTPDAQAGVADGSNVAILASDLPVRASGTVHASEPGYALDPVHAPNFAVHAPDTLVSAPDLPVHAEQACYVIYTSGSTGKPKGATNRHAGLSNRLAWMQQAYGLGPQDTVLQKTPFSFDVSVWEFFWPLMAGARLALAAVGEHRDAERLLGRIVAQQVSTLHFVPSMLHAFVAHCESQEDSATLSAARKVLRRVFCSGEALPAELCARVHALFPAIELHNLYGPTEAAIDVTHWDCARPAATGVPIGRPIAGLRTYVLDAQLNEVPPGVGGELYLGGVGLGRGYLSRPGLSAERFVADPYGSGERLYRTGDLARWNQEGQLEYLGRLDHQVKLRGQRIELGEIEAQLLAQDGVKQAVVLAQAGPALAAVAGPRPNEATDADGLGGPIGQNGFSVSRGLGEPAGRQSLDAQGSSAGSQASLRLVAYVTPASLDTAMLRQALERSLPAYMVPSAIVTLDTLPITANGKLDRKALPQAQFASAQTYEAPQGQLEETLAGIWREVLGVAQVGRHDNFFELGGDSISVMQVSALLRQRHGVAVGLRALFDARDIATLARSPLLNAMHASGGGRDDLAAIDSLLNELEM